jgi:L,D-transpeptidase YcbB
MQKRLALIAEFLEAIHDGPPQKCLTVMILLRYCFFTLVTTTVLLAGCEQSSQTKVYPRPQHDSIIPANSYSELFFDSTTLEQFIVAEKTRDSLASRMRNFYGGRKYEYAWFFKEGLADYTKAFLNLVDDYVGYSGDSAVYDLVLHQLVDSISNKNQITIGKPLILKTELLLTQSFFLYAHRAYQGRNRLNMAELEWFIPRKKINTVAFLDSLVSNKGKYFSSYEPVNAQYRLLKNYVLKYYKVERNGGWPEVPSEKRSYKEGDSSNAVLQLKRTLFLTGDLTTNDSSMFFTSALTGAVKRFQHRYGFKETGVVTPPVLNEMRKPVTEVIRKILINMERMRWVPAAPSTDYLLVNIPEFRLHVYEKGRYTWSMNIVTGSATHNTVVFTGTLKQIVFSPYWYVPPGILNNEILPATRRKKNYLAAHNMEWYGNTVRQKPGRNNSLGLVKFLFPNDYNIYLHDTPAKSLFSEDKRAFSHGCIRLAQPFKLAQYLLRNSPTWDSARIIKAMNSGKEQFVAVKETVPVYIGYFTAWVDNHGELNFRDDVYGHDQKISAHLFNPEK